MKWINAEQELHITVFDEQSDDHKIECMTVENVLDTYTDEGCPPIYLTPENEWIPCSEQLPEEEGSYLVTDDAGGIKTVQDDEFLHYEDGTPLWLYSQNVIAWRPLPEPYGGEQE